jgi:two-component system, NtrC family, response regulator AtoC
LKTIAPRILILDDEKLIRWSLNQIFTQEGYEVDVAATMDEALQLASAKTYGLIFADLEIWSRQKTAKIIIITAVTKGEAEQSLGDVRPFAIIEKPFKSDEIKAVAKEAITLTKRFFNE